MKTLISLLAIFFFSCTSTKKAVKTFAQAVATTSETKMDSTGTTTHKVESKQDINTDSASLRTVKEDIIEWISPGNDRMPTTFVAYPVRAAPGTVVRVTRRTITESETKKVLASTATTSQETAQATKAESVKTDTKENITTSSKEVERVGVPWWLWLLGVAGAIAFAYWKRHRIVALWSKLF